MESTDLQRVNFEEGYVAVIDKPYRWSSTDVVRKVKFELRKAGYRRIKVGHAGTLDPLATGVLLVCIGRATKRVDALQAERKEYIAGVRLGATTPSFDREHTVDRTFPTDHITRPEVERALASLVGERLQTPPLYSAKKIEGTRAYEFARAGEQVEMRQSLVTIYDIELLECRLDNVVYRLGIAPTRAAARQLVSHRHITVDGSVVNIPSYSVKPGQVIGVREKSKSMEVIADALSGFNHSKYPWIEWDQSSMSGKLLHLPERADIPENIKEQLIVELYSK